jgi:integrase
MPKTSWKNGRKWKFPVVDGFNNNITFHLDCRIDKGNKKFILRWQSPTDLDPVTGKKKRKSKSYVDYETALRFVKDFEFREGIRNSKAKAKVTFLTDEQLRDAEMAISLIPNGISLKEIADQYNEQLPNKEVSINKLFEEWIEEASRTGLRESSISSRGDRTKEFRETFGYKKAHKITFQDVEEIVFKKLANGKKPSDQTIVNRWSGIRALLNRGIQKGYVRKDGNPCEVSNGFSGVPTPTPVKTFLSIYQTQSLIKNSSEYKNGIMLSYFALACFSGLQPHEIHGGAFRSPNDADPLTWNDINLESDDPEILVSEDRAKTRMARWAPLKEYNLNLQIILNHAKQLNHDLITVKNFKENWRAVTKLSNLNFEASDADKCRRSFATYLWNKEQSMADVQLSKIMGNSPFVLKKHYKNIIKAGEGEKFFSIGVGGKLIRKGVLQNKKQQAMKDLKSKLIELDQINKNFKMKPNDEKDSQS